MKRFLLVQSVALGLFGASIVSAESSSSTANLINKSSHNRQHSGKILTPQQRIDLLKIRKELRDQMIPLIKEKRAISMQIRRKLTTPHAQWNDLARLVEKRNAVNMKISILWTKTQFQTYQKLGILLPTQHGHHCRFQNNIVSKR